MRQRKIYLLSMFVAIFAGCTEHDDYTTEGVFKPIELSCDIFQRPATRATDAGFAPGDAIGLYLVDYQGGAPQTLTAHGNHANNVKFTFDGTRWEGSSTLYWTSNQSADAYSYYPYRASVDNVTSISHVVQHRQDKLIDDGKMSGYEASDFLWAKAQMVQSGSIIQLNHKHLMAAIQVSLIEGEGFEEGEWASIEKAVSVCNTYLGSTINLQTGEISVDAESDCASIVPCQNGGDWRCIVVPQSIEASKTLIEISMAGEKYTFSRKEMTTYQSGKMHKYALKVDKPLPNGIYKISLISESITAWECMDMSVKSDTREYITINLPHNNLGYKNNMLQTKIDSMGLDYNAIVNLKVNGYLNYRDFNFIKNNLKNLEAINLQDAFLEDDNLCDQAFYYPRDNCIPLNYVVFPKKLKEIGNSAFQLTSIFQHLVFPEGLTHIRNQAFDCVAYDDEQFLNTSTSSSTIYGVTFPTTLEYIGDRAFANAIINHELVLPDHITHIGEAAFLNCRYIVGNLHIPSKLKTINTRTFADLLSVSGTLEVPANIESVELGGFAASNFDGLILHEGLKSIGEAAFAGVVFTNRGYSYGEEILNEYWLEYAANGWLDFTPHPFGGELVIPKSVQHIGKRAFANTAFTHAYLPDNFEELPEGLFHYCTDLMDTIKIPSKVKHLSADVFNHCEKLTAVVLPAKLESVLDRCFANCFNLDYIQCLSTTPPELVGSGHFDGVAKDNFTLVVPKGCVQAYRNAPGWNEFKRISEYKGFVCRPQIARLLNKSNVRTVVLNADAGWQVVHQPSWVSISQTSGIQKTELTVTIDDLVHGAGNRVDSIVFQLAGEVITTCYQIEQFDSEYDEDEQIILQSATRGNGINLVFLGDGYDAKDIADGQYLKDMKQSVEYLFDVEPYKTYRDYFNVYTAYAMSYESGIGTVNTLRNVKFNSIGGDANMRLKCDFDAALYYAIDHTDVEEQEMSGLTCIVIPNTSIYDGVCSMYPNGAAVALCPKSTMDYPYDARGIVQHEAGGHGFGKMADEYIYHYNWIQTCGCSCCKHVPGLQDMHDKGWGYNLWLSGKYKDIPWNHLVNDNRYNDIVDIYDGGYFHKRGVYRSEYNSCMNNNVPYFSSWSRELIVRRIKALAGETFSYDDFVANDSREWGQDFTNQTRAARETPINAFAPHRGNAPIIENRNPVRPKK